MAVLSPLFLALCLVAVRSEETRPWTRYQEEFARLRPGAARGVRQIYVPELRVADRCPTCHLGVEDAALRDASAPFAAHPGDLLRTHPVERFGCTPCHDGDGLATTVEAAHARGAAAARPMLPRAHLQAACVRCHEVPHGVRGAERAARGADLFMERGCYGCHEAPGVAYLPKFAPPLAGLRTKLVDATAWVPAWLKEPGRLRPGTLMPEFGLTDDEATKIAAFVLSLPAGTPLPPVDLGAASAEEGERLFTERGCRGCHAVAADEASVSPRVPNLAGVGSRVRAEWLDRWIADPRAVDPDAAMPKVALTDGERHALVAYLRTLGGGMPAAPAVDPSRVDPAEGRELVRRYECAGCHRIEGFEKARPSVPDLAEFARRPVDELDFGAARDVPRTKWDWLERKLRDPRAFESPQVKLKMPVLRLTDEERGQIATWLLGQGGPPPPAPYRVAASPAARAIRAVAWMTARRNCNGCHRLGDREPRLARFFERKNLLPPVLDGVGARLQGEYLYRFLLEPQQVRPWLQLRMPDFGFTEGEAQVLVAGFAAAGAVANPYTHVAAARLPPDRVERGKRRFAHFKCAQCHPTSLEHGLPEGLDPEDVSINLMLAKTRLRPDWIRRFLARPKEIAGVQTRMPTVFYTIDGQPKLERPDDDIDDITLYLMGMAEPPEAAAAAEEEAKKKAAEERAVDWTTYKY
jgi:cytochrome c2